MIVGRYWVAHARGPNFMRLRERGFLTFFPEMDDYVFLECKPGNEKLLRKQTELCVAFLKARERYITVTGTEIKMMFGQTKAKIEVGANVLVVTGHGSNLEGIVLEVDDEKDLAFCELKGFNRSYRIWVDRMELVESTVAKDISLVEMEA